MNRFNIKRIETTVTIPANRDTFDSPVLSELGGRLKGITIEAPGLTGTSFVLSILGQRGEILFTKSSIVENVITHLNSMSIGGTEYPMDVPISINDVSPVRIKSTGTPDATVDLEFSNDGPIEDGETVTIEDEVYTFREELADGGEPNEVLIEEDVHPTGTITSDETNPANGGNIVIGDQTYVFKTALSEAKATGTIVATANGIPTQNDTIVIGAVTYRFRDTLAQVNDVKIGADGEATLNNLRAAINLTGTPGVEYFAGQQAHPTVTAPSAASFDDPDYELVIEAQALGTGGNAIVLTESASNLTVSGAGTLTGGVAIVANEILLDGGGDADETLENLKAAINGEAGEGTIYSTNTGQPSSGVTASAVVAHVITLTHPDAGPSGNAVVFTKTATHISISGSGTLTGGAWSGDLTLGNLADAINGEDGGGEEGTKYGEGTVAHTQVEAGSVTSHVLEITALESVESGEDVAVETDAAELSFSAETLEDGGEADERVFYVDLLIDRG